MNSQNESPTALPNDALVPLESVLCTEELNRRPARPPDYETENRALAALVQALADSPRTILQTLADTILEVFKADSAGCSLLTPDGTRFHWPAIAGMWRPHIGGGTPRDFGPCGDVLDRNAPLLFKHFELRYSYFLPVTPPVEECLLVPFYVEGKAVGTIWAIVHNNHRKFDAEDMRQLMSLGQFASAAYQAVASLDALEQRGEGLRKSERQLNDFFENASVGLHWVGPDGIILRANIAELDMLGYSEAEYVGHHIAEFHADAEVSEDILERLTKGQTLTDYEARLRRKDGSIRHVLINSNVLWEDGKFVHTRCFTRDITEQKQAEVARALLAAIVQSSGDAIVGETLEGLITSWNAAAEHMFGYTAKEAVGQPITIIIPPERQHEEREILERVGRGESVEHYETVRVADDGRRLDISLTVSPVRDASDRIIGASKVARDITARKQAEEALREKERRFREMIDALPAAIYTTDAEGRLTHYNPAAVEFSGRVPELGTDQWCVSWKLFRPDGTPLPHDECPMAIALKEGRAVRGAEVIAEQPSGKRVWFAPYPSPLRNAEGRVIGGINMLLDITARKQAEEALRRANDELESRVQERTRDLQAQIEETKRAEAGLRALTGRLFQVQDEERRRMARELHDSAGQILAAISMNMTLMRQAKTDAAPFGKLLAESRALLDELTKEIRSLSYLLHPPLLEEAGLNSALRNYVEGYSERSRIRVDLDVSENLGRLSSDLEIVIFRVVQESLTNIHRHSGSTTARIRIVRSARQVEVEISDQGRGIPEDRQRELVTGKSGVGVRGMEERVRHVGGTLQMTSDGNGTCVAVVLPIPASAAASA